jgi:hypothetical protein
MERTTSAGDDENHSNPGESAEDDESLEQVPLMRREGESGEQEKDHAFETPEEACVKVPGGDL